ncbi:glycosyltransferase family 2 protein [Leptolyngbya sp. FACHB-36]|uniref:glycosyltransferase family 2 protein n=1 Tax=Leptolyngbya sp. FACHB-36 TaxID=2692808 RepID=UPI00168100C5|nr:glycosyltransferase family A protein [Leptolyngbya sp. FACHB-36]MBD2022177.1 glycosyltransferase family 2 protein [Leptolyngbya sp. FACHB-36]
MNPTLNPTPLVSVVVPMHNAEAYISETVRSILQENNTALEVVVVSDACTDASPERVHQIGDSRIRMIEGPGRGYVAAVNAGFAAAHGEIIMRCDADDLFPAQRIMRQAEWLTQHPEWGAVCGGFATIDANGRLIANLRTNLAEEITEELQNGIIRNHFCTYAIRAEWIKALGGARPELNGSSELDILLRLSELTRVWYLPEIDYFYRLHDQSLTHNQRNVERLFFDDLIVKLQKQRRTQGQDDLQLGIPLPAAPTTEDDSVLAVDEHVQGQLLGRAWQEHQAGQKFRALATGVRSVATHPKNMGAWRSLLALAVKPAEKKE